MPETYRPMVLRDGARLATAFELIPVSLPEKRDSALAGVLTGELRLGQHLARQRLR